MDQLYITSPDVLMPPTMPTVADFKKYIITITKISQQWSAYIIHSNDLQYKTW